MVELEYLLTHGAECVQRLNEAERFLAQARPEVAELRRELRECEASIVQLQRERDDARTRAAIREEQLQAELAFARRPWYKRLLNT